MNWKIFFKELFTNFWDVIGKPTIKLLIIGSIILVGALIISEYPKIMNYYLDWILMGLVGLAILALLAMLLVTIYQDVYKPAVKKGNEKKMNTLFELRASQLLFSLSSISPLIGLHQEKVLPELIGIAKHYYYNGKYKGGNTIEVCMSSLSNILHKTGLIGDRAAFEKNIELIPSYDGLVTNYGDDEYLIAKRKEVES